LTPEELDSFKPEPVLLKKGEASFHHPLAVHGSYGNKSDKHRRAAVLNYFADGVFSDSDGDLIGGAHVPKVSNIDC
jgi:ectoine hydroxylase-related dioxygenase (phytanoyl-CoA dioxygenase family)